MLRVQRCSRGFGHPVANLIAVAAALAAATGPADARHHRHYIRVSTHAATHVSARHHVSHHSVRDSDYSPPRASIVVDANSGKVLEETNADSLRHPASLTKVMTLYLLFERLDAGKMKLTTEMPVSEHAAEQAPTKLGLKEGQHLAVEDAIRGIVTRSANDAAVVIAEAIGGDEESFAKMMTAKAHALGMSHTTYVNASGLPDDDQNTTARDQATLGRAIQDRFPKYYHYFSTPSFTFRGEEIRNHDHLLGQYGVDGIKTGYTRDSGFNLLTSLHKDGRHVVAVVLGGTSARARDEHMRALLEAHMDEASTRRTATMVAEAAEEPVRVATRGLHPAAAPAPGYSLATVSSVPVHAPNAALQGPILVVKRNVAAANEPIKPIAVKTIKVRLAPMRTASLQPPAAMVPINDQTGATQAPAAPAAPAAAAAPAPAAASAAPAIAALAAHMRAHMAAAAPQQPAVQAAPAPSPLPLPPAPAWQTPAAAAAPVVVATATQAPPKAEPAAPAPTRNQQAHAPTHTGWIIQIGAFGSEDEAKQHLDEAQSKVSSLQHADRFTEPVTKDDKVYYRARFAGLDKSQAEETCKKLRRNDFACMTVKN
ncbi:MAG TPA: D-alanyl-D-alanine carboxypeptidase [Xanthobacteraceae bacterium]|nr:D-alanyl-D-alanine carboxypeptidase [Xanthobacteraceae bacterium]